LNSLVVIDASTLPAGAPILVTGTGTIEGPVAGGDLAVSNLTVADGEVTAKHLVVDSFLELRESAKLGPADGDSITLRSGVVLRFVAPRVESLGLLDLGVAESGVPGRIEIVVGSTEGSVQTHLLVRGDAFENCEKWKEAISEIPSAFEAKCEALGNVLSSGRGMYLSRKLGEEEPSAGNVGMIVGIVVGVIALVVAGGFAFWFFVGKWRGASAAWSQYSASGSAEADCEDGSVSVRSNQSEVFRPEPIFGDSGSDCTDS
jgi:hypothetical protein